MNLENKNLLIYDTRGNSLIGWIGFDLTLIFWKVSLIEMIFRDLGYRLK
jgi:hypothetical protein